MQPGLGTTVVANTLANVPPLAVTVTHVNRHEHIIHIVSHHLHNDSHFFLTADLQKRQKEIVEDPEQRGIREFFGGGDSKVPVEAAEHAGSNTLDRDAVMEDGN